MVPDEVAALEMFDQNPARPKNVVVGLWLAELYKEEWESDISRLIRLMRWSDLPVAPGYDEEFEQKSLSQDRGFMPFEIFDMIEDTPEHFQEALAWLLQTYLETDDEARSQLLAFRNFARVAFDLGESGLSEIFRTWRILQLKKAVGWDLREVAHIFRFEGREIFDFEELAKAIGEPIESAADLWEEWDDTTATSIAEGYMRLFHVDIPTFEEPEETRPRHLRFMGGIMLP